MTTYADPQRCPDCRVLLPRGPQTCHSCGLPLTGTTANELFATFQRADELLGVLRASRVALSVDASVGVGAAGRSSGSRLEGVTPYPSLPSPEAPHDRQRVRSASVPQILLSLGALCLLVAAVTFLAVAWAWLGVSGRTLVLVGLTGAAFGLAHVLFRRELRTASEALSVVALGLVALDVVGAHHAGWLGGTDDSGLVMLAGTFVATAALIQVIATSSRPLVAPALLAPVAALVAGVGAQADVSSPAPLLITTLALLALARVGTLVPSRPLTWTAAAVAALTWVASVTQGFTWVGDDLTMPHLWGNLAIWPLIAAVALAATGGAISGLPVLTRPGCAVAALLAGYVAVLPALDESATVAVASLLAVTAVWTVTAILAPPSWRGAAAVPVIGSAVAPALAAGYLFVTALGAVAGVGAPFSQPFDVSVVATSPELAPWLLAPAVVVLTVAACALLSVAAPLRRPAWYAAAAGAVVVGGIATLPLYDVSLASVVGALVALGAGLLIGAEWLTDRRADVARTAGLVVMVAAAGAALPSDVLTTLVLAVTTFGAGLLMMRTDVTGAAASLAMPLSLAGLVWSGLAVADVPAADRAIPIMLLVGLLAIWRPEPELELGAAVAGTVAALGSVSATDDVALSLAVHLTVAGALVTASALIHPTRRFLAWPGGLLLAAATWVRLAQLGVHAPEAYTLPTALVLVAVGIWRLWQDEDLSTLQVLAPGLTLATVPSLLASLEDPTSSRALLLGAACLALVLTGVALRWSAPLVVGASVGTVLVLRVLGPYAAEVPTWLVIGASGVILTVVGVTWESRMKDLRTASKYVGSLR